ncbi:MAG: hypothetical protein EP330_12880 [Deltaproteobacteria bacterium]|nr:MAG: hypothetical protein EP330_12880 [Deltaproteobacteria bacterium]
MVSVWQGFDFSWDNAPHRLNELTSVTEGDQVRHAFTVGRVPDTGLARSWVTRLAADGVRAIDGCSRVELHAPLGERAAGGTGVVRVPVVGAATAILRGFSLKCESCDVGLHTRGFGIDLEDLRVRDGFLEFSPTAWVHAANSPDPITTGRGDYAYSIELEWSVLSGAPDAVSFAEATPVVHRHRGRPSDLVGELADPGTDHAVLGVRGLSVSQEYRGRWGRDGRFLRRVQAGVDDVDHRAGRFRPHLHFTNKGWITYPVQVEQRLHTTLIGFSSGEAKRQRVETRIRTGIGDGGRAIESLPR